MVVGEIILGLLVFLNKFIYYYFYCHVLTFYVLFICCFSLVEYKINNNNIFLVSSVGMKIRTSHDNIYHLFK